MGIIVDAGVMAGEVEQINAMLSTAKGAIAGCASAIGAFALDSELSGAAYSGAKAYFAHYLPALSALNAQIDAVETACQGVLSALGACPDLGYGNEDVLLEEKEALLREREELGSMADNAYCMVIIGGVKQYVEDTAFRNSCMSKIALIDEKLEKIDRILEQLRSFNGCAAFAGVEADCAALKTSISAIRTGSAPGADGSDISYQNRMLVMRKQLENLNRLSTPPTTPEGRGDVDDIPDIHALGAGDFPPSEIFGASTTQTTTRDKVSFSSRSPLGKAQVGTRYVTTLSEQGDSTKPVTFFFDYDQTSTSEGSLGIRVSVGGTTGEIAISTSNPTISVTAKKETAESVQTYTQVGVNPFSMEVTKEDGTITKVDGGEVQNYNRYSTNPDDGEKTYGVDGAFVPAPPPIPAPVW